MEELEKKLQLLENDLVNLETEKSVSTMLAQINSRVADLKSVTQNMKNQKKCVPFRLKDGEYVDYDGNIISLDDIMNNKHVISHEIGHIWFD